MFRVFCSVNHPLRKKKGSGLLPSPGILAPEPLGACSVLGLGLLGSPSQSSLVVGDLDPVALAGTIQTGQSIEGPVESA